MNIREMLVEFHDNIGCPIASFPMVPQDDRVRLRASLIAEECLEFLEACFSAPGTIEHIREKVEMLIATGPVLVEMAAAADALADIAYVVEGSNLEVGIPTHAVLDEVHRSNMAKAGGPVREDGKRLKPAGWMPPDIIGVLRKHGYEQ